MKKRVTLILMGLLLWAGGNVGAQEIDRTAPYLKVTCSIRDAHITVEQLAIDQGPALNVDEKPVQLNKGAEYVLSVTKVGYEPYRKSFNADWQGLQDKKVSLKRGIGPAEGKVWLADLEDNVVMEFVPIPAGRFQMGSYEGESDERPVRTVQFERPFWMAKTEVSNQQFRQFRKDYPVANGKQYKYEENEVPMPQGAELPVTYIQWNEAMNYCKWLTKKERRRGRLPEGFEYALPTEAEWEYACRAGTIGDFAGNVASMAWYVDNSGQRTNPVGQKKPNAWGLYDMHGNVWEWCADEWYASYVNAPVNGSQRGDANDEYVVDRTQIDNAENIHRLYSAKHRVVRGGCWSYSALDCRSANRYYHTPDYQINYLGFRPVLLWTPPILKLKTTTRLKRDVE